MTFVEIISELLIYIGTIPQIDTSLLEHFLKPINCSPKREVTSAVSQHVITS